MPPPPNLVRSLMLFGIYTLALISIVFVGWRSKEFLLFRPSPIPSLLSEVTTTPDLVKQVEKQVFLFNTLKNSSTPPTVVLPPTSSWWEKKMGHCNKSSSSSSDQISPMEYFSSFVDPLKKNNNDNSFSFLIDPPVVVICPNHMYGIDKNGFHSCSPLPVSCIWSSNTSLTSLADAGYYFQPNKFPTNDNNCYTKITIAHTMEQARSNNFKNLGFNASSTYHLDSEIITPYVGEWILTLNETLHPSFFNNVNKTLDKDDDNKEKEVNEKEKQDPYLEKQLFTRRNAAVFISRNCHSQSGREKYIQQLQKYIPVHSIGQCLNNQPWPIPNVTNHFHDWQKKKIDALLLYKIYLAFENSIGEDYVTEKIFNGLTSGAIPVYLGSDSIHKFIPFKDSFINVKDFTNIRELGLHLKHILDDNHLLTKYHQWRRQPMPPDFIHTWSFLRYSPECRTCLFAYSNRHNYTWDQPNQMFNKNNKPLLMGGGSS